MADDGDVAVESVGAVQASAQANLTKKAHVGPYPLKHGGEHSALKDSERMIGDNHRRPGPRDLLKVKPAHTIRDG